MDTPSDGDGGGGGGEPRATPAASACTFTLPHSSSKFGGGAVSLSQSPSLTTASASGLGGEVDAALGPAASVDPARAHPEFALTPVSNEFLQVSGLFERIRHIWDLPVLRTSHVPCSNPRSLTRTDLRAIKSPGKSMFYKLGLKTDGVRMLLYLGKYASPEWRGDRGGDRADTVPSKCVTYAVMIDRAFNVYDVQIKGGSFAGGDGTVGELCPKWFNGTLFDGELVSSPPPSLSAEPRSSSTPPTAGSPAAPAPAAGVLDVVPPNVVYVAFDAVCVKGVDFRRARHSERMREVDSAFTPQHPARRRTAPLTLFTTRDDGDDGVQIPVEVKEWLQWHDVQTAFKIYRELGVLGGEGGVTEGVHRGVACDGLIFVYEFGVLRAGTQPDMFKWKPAHEHTIDFLWDLRFKRLMLSVDDDTFVSGSALNVFIADAWREKLKTHRAILECRVKKVWIDATFSCPIGATETTDAAPSHPPVLKRQRATTPDHGPDATARGTVNAGRSPPSATPQRSERWEATPVCVRTDKKRPNNAKIAELTLANISELLGLDEIITSPVLATLSVE